MSSADVERQIAPASPSTQGGYEATDGDGRGSDNAKGAATDAMSETARLVG
jgi:hypothetical protein